MCDFWVIQLLVVAMASFGCWSISAAASLLRCYGGRRCKLHVTWRRCVIVACLGAWRQGGAGLAVGLAAMAFVPQNLPLIASAALFVGGLANFSPADWRRIVADWLQAALDIVKRGRRER